ncbi:D-alanyl-D-alanine carboxypeptidase [Oscillospiraceae bacterium OttesenSCG-928-G22]|nr:D-alanyl-D-alanine carboxypeptidase [Oscillospiraceae bacterium OttesenSCG-928-G22]
MKRTRLFILTLAISLCASSMPAGAAAESAPGAPAVSAASAALYDCESGRFLYLKDADTKRGIASTTKIMTALVAIETLDLEKVVTFQRDWITEGSSMHLRVGEKVSVRDLLYGLMLMSGNDAAISLANAAAGSVVDFADLMNDRAEKLGLSGTSFRNPNGLDVEGHYSTARDLAILTAEAMKNPLFSEIVGSKTYVMEGRSMRNHNRLLRELEGCDGVKTGFTKRCGRCLVSSVTRDGRRLIAVTLNAPSDWKDHKALYDYGFSTYPNRELILEGDRSFFIPVMSGETGVVRAYADDTISVGLTEEEYSRVERKLHIPKFVYAPVQAHAKAGEVLFLLDGEEIGRVTLRYASAVKPSKT